MKNIKRFNLFLFLFISIQSHSQLVSEISDYVDSQIGIQNSYLFNGKTYSNNYRVLSKKNQFLNESTSYTIGSITCQQISFNSVELLYDVFSQELIIKPDSKTSLFGIVIDTSKLDGFKMYDKTFINIKKQGEISGFFELSIDKPFLKLLIKHNKKRQKLLDRNSIHFEFESNYDFVLFHKNKYVEANSKKDFLKIFPIFKKGIKEFYAKNHLLEKNDKKEFMKKIVLYLNILNDSDNEK